MLWPNLNSPSVLWEKLAWVKDCVIVRVNSQILEGNPSKGRMEREVVNFFDRSLTLSMFWSNLIWAPMLID